MDKKVALIKFVDRTFNCNPEFAMEIWKYLMKMNTDTRFHFEISADIFNDEEIKLLLQAPANRFQFEIGVQTTNDIVLGNINRHVKFEDIKRSILQLKKNKGIKLHLDLIAGLPGENFESFANSFNEIYALNPDEIQFRIFKAS
jgi:coproporphyrinogen III oxidase-like Fe-S oxidoreductase